jgi:hypothetical protein
MGRTRPREADRLGAIIPPSATTTKLHSRERSKRQGNELGGIMMQIGIRILLDSKEMRGAVHKRASVNVTAIASLNVRLKNSTLLERYKIFS